MLSFIGFGLVLFASVMFTLKKTELERSKLETIEEYVRFFRMLADKMEFSKRPLSCLIAEMQGESFCRIAPFLKRLCDTLTDHQNLPLSENWKWAMEGLAIPLPQTVRTSLESVGVNLGQMSEQAELENLRQIEKELCAALEEERIRYRKNEKMLKSAGVLVGILIAVLFL